MNKINRGLFIGRFQPYHNGHQSVVEQIAKDLDELIIGIGSAQISHEVDNPFTAGERVTMIAKSINELGLDCPIYVIPIEDVKRNSLWVDQVRSMTPSFNKVYSSNPLVIQLFTERGIPVESTTMYRRDICSGTEVRRRMLSKEDWSSLLPKSAKEFIKEIGGVERICKVAGNDCR